MEYKIKLTNLRSGKDAWIGPLPGMIMNQNDGAWTFSGDDAQKKCKEIESKLNGFSVSIWAAI